MKQPQLFIQVGRNKYSPVYSPLKGVDLFAWDEDKQRIVPYKAPLSEALRAPESCESSGGSKYTPAP